MTDTNSTKEIINKLIEYRQAVYQHAITARRDALVALGPVTSFAMLSQAAQFQRKWPSLYAAVEDGRLNEGWLRTFLAHQVPHTGICFFALDESPGRGREPWRIASMSSKPPAMSTAAPWRWATRTPVWRG